MNFYEELELNISCTKDEIKKSYKRLAMIHHPDRGGNEERFKKISQAYETLSDDNKRKEYDHQRTTPQNPFGGTGYGSGRNPFSQFFDFGGNSGPIPGNPKFSFGRNFSRENENNEITLEQELELELSEAYNGCIKEISSNFTKKCSCYTECQYCRGKGTTQNIIRQGPFVQMYEKICEACLGKGFSVKSDCEECDEVGKYEKTVKFKITFKPRIIYKSITIVLKDGQKNYGKINLRIKIKNSISSRAGTREPEGTFEVEKNHLIYKTKIDFIDTICGKDITIPLFKENDNLKINTYDKFGIILEQNKYRISELGFKFDNPDPGNGNEENSNNEDYGDLIIVFKINYPTKKYTQEEREKLRQILDSH